MTLAKPKQTVIGRWNRFWFETGLIQNLALVRIFFAIALLTRVTGATGIWRWDELTAELPKKGLWPSTQMIEFGGWVFRYDWFAWLPLPSIEWCHRFEWILMILTVLIIVGAFTRIVLPLAALILTYFFMISPWNFYHHMLVYVIVLWILTFSPCHRHYSFDAIRMDPIKRFEPTTVLPLRLIQTLICLIYLFTFLWKANLGWVTGDIMRLFELAGAFKGEIGKEFSTYVPHQTQSLGTIVLELALPLCLPFEKTRRIIILFGIGLHLMIDATMNVNSYSYQMMALYVVFIHPRSGATVVFYDGRCGMCRGSRRLGIGLDWFKRVTWLDFRQAEVRDRVPHISDDQLQQEMYLITNRGEVLPGFLAWRHLLNSFPLTFIPSFVLYLPGMEAIGNRVYKYIADRRNLSCELPMEPDGSEAWKTSLAFAARNASETIEKTKESKKSMKKDEANKSPDTEV